MTDHVQEQEMEIEALQAILMDDIKEIDCSESGLNTGGRCFQIILSPKDDDDDDSSTDIPVFVALTFAHSEKYPDEPPILGVKSLQGMGYEDVKQLKEKLEHEAVENLGMAMIYTLVTSAKEWLREKYSGTEDFENGDTEDTSKDDIITPHGEAVTVETFLAWRERFEAEQALERAKFLPESALTAPKEKKLTGRQWFEMKGGKPTVEESEEDEEEDIDFDEDFDDDEEDMLDHYLTEKSQGSSHGSSLSSSRR
uniref:TSA: Wollemia nobilis Ref_Wollemi_Transcript_15442_1175 transcribed RNA sequence n=1 Tax=Wollemia nobilis TaxID=56998 RepID=A0A0C9S675_9CONI